MKGVVRPSILAGYQAVRSVIVLAGRGTGEDGEFLLLSTTPLHPYIDAGRRERNMWLAVLYKWKGRPNMQSLQDFLIDI